jgi:hypothetical protein
MINEPFLFPITGWEIKSAPVEGILSVRFPFLCHEQQKLAEADPGRPYVMQAEQAREFRDALTRAIDHMESQEPGLAANTELDRSLLIY